MANKKNKEAVNKSKHPILQNHLSVRYDKNDWWGSLNIYFDFDIHEKVRILDITFDSIKAELPEVIADNQQSVMQPKLDLADENLGVNYVEQNGHFIVDGDMVLMNKMVLIDRDSSTGKQVQYIVLTNDSDITWEKVKKNIIVMALVLN